MVDTGATSSTTGKKKKGKHPEPHHDRPPQIEVAGIASPIIERPEDYLNADAVYSTGEGSISGYHYDRRDTYAHQLAGAEAAQVKGPGQA